MDFKPLQEHLHRPLNPLRNLIEENFQLFQTIPSWICLAFKSCRVPRTNPPLRCKRWWFIRNVSMLAHWFFPFHTTQVSPEKKKTRGAPRTIPRMWKFVITAQMQMPFHPTYRSFCPFDEDLYGLHTLYKHIPTCRKYRRKCSLYFLLLLKMFFLFLLF